MPNRTSRIQVPIKFDQWIAGLETMSPGGEVQREWRDATERFYGRSQEHVHRITGALQASGRHDTTRTGPSEVTGTLTYSGSPDREYAVYEIARGGSHDFITTAFAQSRADFQRALADGIDAHVRSFL